ncbi:CUN072 hypothetical protein [Culex nigripalpus nucleopolyhedrovirus]|uniref:Uncharacterized protein n=1 Tax=Culex nigripalpus nucleopolyhedrovirus (isolate Florida/1997) TaxID=645993 RepID=Q919K4_NPVCO|nr:CUN072 hypothetical protein [Culex nigripalpus nucleopolyhedrovirus]AAK94150.1 CUN072 hypothetical protein [Culex nigripalpus nucleopolyhedrovirus]
MYRYCGKSAKSFYYRNQRTRTLYARPVGLDLKGYSYGTEWVRLREVVEIRFCCNENLLNLEVLTPAGIRHFYKGREIPATLLEYGDGDGSCMDFGGRDVGEVHIYQLGDLGFISIRAVRFNNVVYVYHKDLQYFFERRGTCCSKKYLTTFDELKVSGVDPALKRYELIAVHHLEHVVDVCCQRWSRNVLRDHFELFVKYLNKNVHEVDLEANLYSIYLITSDVEDDDEDYDDDEDVEEIYDSDSSVEIISDNKRK